VNPANVDKTIALIRAEIARYVTEPVTDEELADCQANYIGRLPLSLESNVGVAAALLNLERYSLGLDYYLRYPDLISSVTPGEIMEISRQYLNPDCLAIATAGTFNSSN
jgi:zinc protease